MLLEVHLLIILLRPDLIGFVLGRRPVYREEVNGGYGLVIMYFMDKEKRQEAWIRTGRS